MGEERSVVFEEAGTTRDSVDALVEWPGAGRIRFVDTAGMRRAIRVQGVEYYSFVRAGEAIDRADAVAVIFDATEGLTAEDEKIAFRVLEAGKALLLVANKWDLVEDKDRTFKRLTEEATMLGRATVVRSSAVRGQGVTRIPELLLDLRRRWAGRASTSRVNEVLQEAQGAQPPPRSSGHRCTTPRKWRPGRPPSSSSVGEELPVPATAGTSRTGSARRSVSTACRSG